EIPITPGADITWMFSTKLTARETTTVEVRATHSESLEGSTTFAVTQEGVPSQDISSAGAIVFEPSTETAFVVDRGLDAVFSVDVATGARTLLSGSGVGNGPDLLQPDGRIDIDEVRNQLVVTDRRLDAIVGIDLDTGDRRIISDSSTAGAGVSSPIGIAVDGPNGVAYYTDSTLDGVARVDLITGARTVLSDDTVPAAPQPIDFNTPQDVAIDAARNRLIVSDSSLDALVEVSLNDGSRRAIEPPTADGRLVRPRALVLDGDRALVLDEGARVIVSVDLETGERTELSSLAVGVGPRFSRSRDLAYDAVSGRAWVVDTDFRVPLVVEVDTTGDRFPLLDVVAQPVG
ncbi:MAG: hypothetical protein AAF658_22480, partial [Myxococcota bacterium]